MLHLLVLVAALIGAAFAPAPNTDAGAWEASATCQQADEAPFQRGGPPPRGCDVTPGGPI